MSTRATWASQTSGPMSVVRLSHRYSVSSARFASSAYAALPVVRMPYVGPAVGNPASGVSPMPVGQRLSSSPTVPGSSATQA